MPLPRAEALGIGPSSFELDLLIDGFNSTTIYFNSDGVTGELIIGKEDLPFRMEPSRVNMSSGDVSVPVELTFYGNETLEPGVYEGKVTFIAYTGGFVSVGIKIRTKINLLEATQEFHHEEEQETLIEEEPMEESEPEAETEPDEETEAEQVEPVRIETYESEQEPEPETQMDYTPYLMGAAITALALIVWWIKR